MMGLGGWKLIFFRSRANQDELAQRWGCSGMLGTRFVSLSCHISEKPSSEKGQFSVRALGQFQSIFQIPVKLLSLLTALGLIWTSQDLIYPSVKSKIRKTQNPSRAIFQWGGYAIFYLKIRSRSNYEEFDQCFSWFDEWEARSMKPRNGFAKYWTIPKFIYFYCF